MKSGNSNIGGEIMKVNVGYSGFIDVIEFEPFLGEDMEKYKDEFAKWFFELVYIGHLPYYVKKASLHYKDIDGEAVVDWMNETAPGCNAKILQKKLFSWQEDKSLPHFELFP